MPTAGQPHSVSRLDVFCFRGHWAERDGLHSNIDGW